MKLRVVFAVLALTTWTAAATRGVQTPITRVVKLLKGLSMKVEMEGKAEEKLYDKYVCWAQNILDTKSASNAAAKTKIETLQTYISDIQAGRLEFTGERASLEKELMAFNQEIDRANALRAEEHEQFVAAETELTQGIEALNIALEVLGAVTTKYANGTAFAQRTESDLNVGSATEAGSAASLKLAVKLGSRVLSAGDAIFLRRLLTAEVPKPDWKKLNRRAKFKMSYKARSGSIVTVLSELKATFSAKLEEARDKETQAHELHVKLMSSKNSQKSDTQEALRHLVAETGARQLSMSEAQDQVTALQEQMTSDNTFLEQVRAELAQKKREWKDRQALRTAELAAFSKAIEILHNDEARDLMKKSYASQGYSLLQESSAESERMRSASQVLRRASRDSRVSAIALRMARTTDFLAVTQAIDNMIETLTGEEQTDLEQKELCEKHRAEDTREAALLSREMDDITDSTNKLKADIKDLEADILEKNETWTAVQSELQEATSIRSAEHQQWQRSDAEDKEMARIVEQAKQVLQEFYTTNGLMLAQQPGMAPPPPPKTWDSPYGGKTQQATGVITTLGVIKDDIEKDIKTASAAESVAAAKFVQFEGECETEMTALADSISKLTGTKGEKEEDLTELAAYQVDSSGSLHAVMDQIAGSSRSCEYITINYPVRLRNRQIEIDGLNQAKAILAGARFDDGPDPNRELKPGDTFLLQPQGKRK